MTAMKPLLLSATLLALGNAAFAQQFAGQVVTMIVNYSAGGPTDVEARVVAQHLPTLFKRQLHWDSRELCSPSFFV